MDAFYGRGSMFPFKYFLNDGVSKTLNRRIANLVSKNVVIEYSSHGGIHCDAI